MKRTIVTLLLVSLGFLLSWYLWPATKLQGNAAVDRIKVYKSERELRAFSRGKLIGVFRVSLGSSPTGHKHFEGDGKTPSGRYTIDSKSSQSAYFLNLGVSYPNTADLDYARQHGKSAGGEIKIHGLPNGQAFIGRFHRFSDWTNGCIALTNEEVSQLYDRVSIGTPIEIFE